MPVPFSARSAGTLTQALTRGRSAPASCPGRQGPQAWGRRAAMRAYAWTATGAGRFGLALRVLARLMPFVPRRAGWAHTLPGPLQAWTSTRHFPTFTPRGFRRRVRQLDLAARPTR